MQTLPGIAVVDRSNIQPQLDVFFGEDMMSPERRKYLMGLVRQLNANGNAVFTGGSHEGPHVGIPILLDDENLDRLIHELPQQEGPTRPTIIAAGNVSAGGMDHRRRGTNKAGLKELGRLCGSVDMPFSHYEVTYPESTAIGRVRADMHGSGMLDYDLRMRELHRPPKDRLVIGCDADVRGMDPDYISQMQVHFESSSTPAWLGAPEVLHDRLDDRFPRINHLLTWYDKDTEYSYRFGPTHYGFNMAAYAAVGGIGLNASFGETGPVYDALVERFGKENIEKGYLNAQVVASARHLVHRMIAGGEKVEYEHLHVPPGGTGDSYRNLDPTEDISIARMHELLAGIVRVLYRKYDKRFRATEVGVNPKLAGERAKLKTFKRLLVMAESIGDVDGSLQMVEDALRSIHD